MTSDLSHATSNRPGRDTREDGEKKREERNKKETHRERRRDETRREEKRGRLFRVLDNIRVEIVCFFLQ